MTTVIGTCGVCIPSCKLVCVNLLGEVLCYKILQASLQSMVNAHDHRLPFSLSGERQHPWTCCIVICIFYLLIIIEYLSFTFCYCRNLKICPIKTGKKYREHQVPFLYFPSSLASMQPTLLHCMKQLPPPGCPIQPFFPIFYYDLQHTIVIFYKQKQESILDIDMVEALKHFHDDIAPVRY